MCDLSISNICQKQSDQDLIHHNPKGWKAVRTAVILTVYIIMFQNTYIIVVEREGL